MAMVNISPFDLHLHTTASDGTRTPGDMVRWAHALGLRCVAITDHDTIGGLSEARQAGESLALPVISGIEITVFDDVEIHLLGYGLNVGSQSFARLGAFMRGQRDQRNRLLLQRLDAQGITLPAEFMPGDATGVYGRSHVARGLVAGGYARDVNDAFARYLLPGGLAYVPREHLRAGQALQMILSCGGKPVLAHPGRVEGLDSAALRRWVGRLGDQGLAGLEVYYPSHTPGQVAAFLSWADAFGLVPTYGSDCHGHGDHAAHPGHSFPQGALGQRTYDFIYGIMQHNS